MDVSVLTYDLNTKYQHCTILVRERGPLACQNLLCLIVDGHFRLIFVIVLLGSSPASTIASIIHQRQRMW